MRAPGFAFGQHARGHRIRVHLLRRIDAAQRGEFGIQTAGARKVLEEAHAQVVGIRTSGAQQRFIGRLIRRTARRDRP